MQDLQGAAAVADFLLHTLSPLMCVLGFLVFDTHGYARVLLNSLLVAVVFAGLSFGALALDRVLPRTRLCV